MLSNNSTIITIMDNVRYRTASIKPHLTLLNRYFVKTFDVKTTKN